MRPITAGMLIVAAFWIPFRALATPRDSLNADDPGIYHIDYSIPDLTGYGLLGVDANTVTKPANVREFASAILQGVGRDGHVQSGVAVDWAPLRSLGNQSRRAYLRTRLVRNLQVSAASVKEDPRARMAMGVRWIPIDRTDPLADPDLHEKASQILDEVVVTADKNPPLARVGSALTGAWKDRLAAEPLRFGEAISQVLEALRGATSGESALAGVDRALATVAISRAALPESTRLVVQSAASELAEINTRIARGLSDAEKRLGAERERFKQAAWNKTVVELAAGTTWASDGGTWSGLKTDRFSSFAGAGVGLTNHGQGILQLKYDNAWRSASDTTTSWTAGGRLLAGSSDIHGSLEAAHTRTRTKSKGELKTTRLAAGVEFQVISGAWLEVAIGGTVPENGPSKIFSLASVKYALRNESDYAKRRNYR